MIAFKFNIYIFIIIIQKLFLRRDNNKKINK